MLLRLVFRLESSSNRPPIPRLGERSPVVWVLSYWITYHAELRVSQRLRTALSGSEPLIEIQHEISRGGVAHRPKTKHLTFSASHHKGSSEAVHTLGAAEVTDACIARR